MLMTSKKNKKRQQRQQKLNHDYTVIEPLSPSKVTIFASRLLKPENLFHTGHLPGNSMNKRKRNKNNNNKFGPNFFVFLD